MVDDSVVLVRVVLVGLPVGDVVGQRSVMLGLSSVATISRSNPVAAGGHGRSVSVAPQCETV